jgi:hypothetical protein
VTAQHRALVRRIRLAEGDVAADRSAVDNLERLRILIEHLPLTFVARTLMLDWIAEARTALLLHLWPAGPLR